MLGSKDFDWLIAPKAPSTFVGPIPQEVERSLPSGFTDRAMRLFISLAAPPSVPPPPKELVIRAFMHSSFVERGPLRSQLAALGAIGGSLTSMCSESLSLQRSTAPISSLDEPTREALYHSACLEMKLQEIVLFRRDLFKELSNDTSSGLQTLPLAVSRHAFHALVGAAYYAYGMDAASSVVDNRLLQLPLRTKESKPVPM